MSHIFRVFLSSTFRDWTAEREHLRYKVFPDLAEWVEKEGKKRGIAARFLPVDLRWGISEEASRNNIAVDICLDEIKRCQKISPKPNFLVFLGQRYGWRPLPPRVSDSNKNKLIEIGTTTGADFESCYQEDTNARCHDSEWILKLDTASETSDKVYSQLSKHYLKHKQKWLDTFSSRTDDITFLIGSIVEQEVVRGALGGRKAESHVHAFKRVILARDLLESKGLSEFVLEQLEHVTDNKAELLQSNLEEGKPIGRGLFDSLKELILELPLFGEASGRVADNKELKDIIEGYINGKESNRDPLLDRAKGFLSGDQCRLLQFVGTLREYVSDDVEPSEALHAALETTLKSDENGVEIHEYTVGGFPEDDSGLKSTEKEKYLDQFAADVVKSLKASITEELDRIQAEGGAVDVAPDLEDYLERPEQQQLESWDGSKPMLLFGEAGTGKSTLLAKTVELHKKKGKNVLTYWIGRDSRCAIGSGLLQALLQDIKKHVTSSEINFDEVLSMDPNELADTARKALASMDGSVLIVIDAVDQLLANDFARNLSWLNPAAPVLFSSLDEEQRAAFEADAESGQVIKLGNMAPDDSAELLKKWLNRAKRTLTDEQRKAVLKEHNGKPLHLRILFERARLLRSFDVLESKQCDWLGGENQPTENAITDLYNHLAREEEHGSVMVQRTLAYLASTPFGVPEDVLLELLRKDDVIIDEFKQRSPNSPDAGKDRLPEIVWSRLYHDLEPFLARRLFYGEVYLDFYHAQFRRVVINTENAWVDETIILGCRKLIEEWAGDWGVEQSPTLCAFLFHHSIESAVSSNNEDIMNKATSRLCDFGYLMHRMQLTQGEENRLEMDYDRLISSKVSRNKNVAQNWNQWKQFVKSKFHYFLQSDQQAWPSYQQAWPSYKMLLQFAFESAHENVVEQANEWWKNNNDKWIWLKASDSTPEAKLFSFGSPFYWAEGFNDNCVLLETVEGDLEIWKIFELRAELLAELHEHEVGDGIVKATPISSTKVLIRTESEKQVVWDFSNSEIIDKPQLEGLCVESNVDHEYRQLDGSNYVAYLLSDSKVKISLRNGSMQLRQPSNEDILLAKDSGFIPLTIADEYVHIDIHDNEVLQVIAADGCIITPEDDVISWRGNQITYWVYNHSSKQLEAKWDSGPESIHKEPICSFKIISSNTAMSIDNAQNVVFWDDLLNCRWKGLTDKFPVNDMNILSKTADAITFFSHIAESSLTVYSELTLSDVTINYWGLPEYTIPLLKNGDKLICGNQAELQVYDIKAMPKYGSFSDVSFDYPIQGVYVCNKSAYSYSENGQIKRWDLESSAVEDQIDLDDGYKLNGLKALPESHVIVYGKHQEDAWVGWYNLRNGQDIFSFVLSEDEVIDVFSISDSRCALLLESELKILDFSFHPYKEPNILTSIEISDKFEKINGLELPEGDCSFWLGNSLLWFNGEDIKKTDCGDTIEQVYHTSGKLIAVYENKGMGYISLNEFSLGVNESSPYLDNEKILSVRIEEGKGVLALCEENEVCFLSDKCVEDIGFGRLKGLFISSSLDDAIAWYVDGDCLPVSLVAQADVVQPDAEKEKTIEKVIGSTGILFGFKDNQIVSSLIKEQLNLKRLNVQLDSLNGIPEKQNIVFDDNSFNAISINKDGEKTFWYGNDPQCCGQYMGKFVVIDGGTKVRVLSAVQ